MKNGKKLLLLLLVLAVLVCILVHQNDRLEALEKREPSAKMPPIRRTKRRQCFLSTRKT